MQRSCRLWNVGGSTVWRYHGTLQLRGVVVSIVGLTLYGNDRIWRPKKSRESNGRSSEFPSFEILAVVSPRKRGRHRQAATWSRAISAQTTLRVDIIWGTASDAFFNPLPSPPHRQLANKLVVGSSITAIGNHG